MLFGFRALESSLKITNLMVVFRLFLCVFSSFLDTSRVDGAFVWVRVVYRGCVFIRFFFRSVGFDVEYVVVEENFGFEADFD